MTNFEKYKERLLKIVDSMDEGIAVCNGVPYSCEDAPCDDCDFYCGGSGSCEARFIRWLYQEYEEKPKLTEGQYHFLKALSNGARIKIRDGAFIIAVGVNGQDSLYMKERSMNHYFSGVPDLKPNVWYEVSKILKWEVEG